MKWILAIAIASVFMTGCKSTSGLKVVADFETERYLGTWYEMARNDHRFERNMSNVSATYSKNNDGTIKVLNRGFKEGSQEWSRIEGVAKLKDRPDQGWLKVSFFKPFYASYKIIHLDEAYSEAIVTSSTYGYFWILTRKPDFPQEDLERLLKQAENMGFDRSGIILVNQSRNIQ